MASLAEESIAAAVVAVPQKASGPGVRLAQQREAFGWTIEQVATQLNLAPRQIMALESDNFSALPGMASVRGFIRSYAKLLKIDAEPLLESIASPTSAPLVEPLSMRRALSAPFFDDSRMSAMGMQGPQQKTNYLLPGVVLVVLGLFAGYYLGFIPQLPNLLAHKPAVETVAAPESAASTPTDERKPESDTAQMQPLEESPSASMTATAETPAAATAASTPVAPVVSAVAPAATTRIPQTAVQSPATSVPAAAQKPTATSTTPATTPAAAAVVTANPSKPNAPAATTTANGTTTTTQKPPEPVKATDSMPIPAGNRGALVLRFSQDSWVDLRRADSNGPNSVIASRLIKAGSTETFDLPDSAVLTVGNANGVDGNLRGGPLDIKGNAKNNVARLTLK
jgi:cytoskeleton protein RodZ